MAGWPVINSPRAERFSKMTELTLEIMRKSLSSQQGEGRNIPLQVSHRFRCLASSGLCSIPFLLPLCFNLCMCCFLTDSLCLLYACLVTRHDVRSGTIQIHGSCRWSMSAPALSAVCGPGSIIGSLRRTAVRLSRCIPRVMLGYYVIYAASRCARQLFSESTAVTVFFLPNPPPILPHPYSFFRHCAGLELGQGFGSNSACIIANSRGSLMRRPPTTSPSTHLVYLRPRSELPTHEAPKSARYGSQMEISRVPYAFAVASRCLRRANV